MLADCSPQLDLFRVQSDTSTLPVTVHICDGPHQNQSKVRNYETEWWAVKQDYPQIHHFSLLRLIAFNNHFSCTEKHNFSVVFNIFVM